MASVVNDRLLRGRDIRVGIFPQATKGVVDASPVFVPYRRTTGKPTVTIGYTQDETIQLDNQGQQNIQDTKEYTVEIESSVSKQTIGLLIQAIHGVEVAYTNTAITFEATATGFILPAATYAALSVSDGFWIEGFDNDEIDGFYIVASKDGANEITTTIAPVAAEAAGESVTLTTNKTVNADAPTYNLIQRRVTDLSEATDISYLTLYDAVLNTLSIEIGETGIVTNSAAFVAERRIEGTGSIAGQTYAAASTDRSISAVQNIPGFYVDGLDYTCIQKSMSIEVNNNYAGDDAAGCTRQFARGQFAVSGSAAFRARISNSLDWERFYQEGTTKSLGVRISHGGGDETYIVMPQALITEHSQADGANDVANHEVSFGAEGNAATNSTIMVFRNWV